MPTTRPDQGEDDTRRLQLLETDDMLIEALMNTSLYHCPSPDTLTTPLHPALLKRHSPQPATASPLLPDPALDQPCQGHHASPADLVQDMLPLDGEPLTFPDDILSCFLDLQDFNDHYPQESPFVTQDTPGSAVSLDVTWTPQDVTQNTLGSPLSLGVSQGTPGSAVSLDMAWTLQDVPQDVSWEVPVTVAFVGVQESPGAVGAGQGVAQGVTGAVQTCVGGAVGGRVAPPPPVCDQAGPGEGKVGAGTMRGGRRAPRSRRTKLYERQEPYDDPLQEKRRRDAVNARRIREQHKARQEKLRRCVAEAEKRRDELREAVEALRAREAELLALISMSEVPTPPHSHDNTTTRAPPQTPPVSVTHHLYSLHH